MTGSRTSISPWRSDPWWLYLDPTLLYLFTASDLKTIVIPSSLFGIIGSACDQVVIPTVTTFSPEAIIRWPLVVLWVWINLLPLNINNQTGPGAMEEDSINKSWRALPRGLVSMSDACSMMLFWYILSVAYSWYLGALPQSLSLIFFGFWYNRYGGADGNWIIRNALNVAGYISFVSGAITVASKVANWTPLGYIWLATIALLIMTTIQIQDLPDQEGDVARGRRTMPLVIGDMPCRIYSALVVVAWSIMVVRFWNIPINWLWLPIVLSSTIAWRCMRYNKSVDSDKLTYKVYNLWIMSVYAAPLFSSAGIAHLAR